jgi:hypothetical protein
MAVGNNNEIEKKLWNAADELRAWGFHHGDLPAEE